MTGQCCEILELRQYTLHPGRRDVLIDLFDRQFVETQESTGMRIVGQFRDDADPDRFVWIRGFADMAARRRALTEFYLEGEAWSTYGDAARATMIDSSDALLLRPVRPDAGFDLSGLPRPPIDASSIPASRVMATVCAAESSFETEFATFFEMELRPVLEAAGGRPIAVLQSEHSANTFPRLPVREGENIFVWFTRFADLAAVDHFTADLERSAEWTDKLLPQLGERLSGVPPQQLILSPTARSALR